MEAEMGEVDRACRPLSGVAGADAMVQDEAWFET